MNTWMSLLRLGLKELRVWNPGAGGSEPVPGSATESEKHGDVRGGARAVNLLGGGATFFGDWGEQILVGGLRVVWE